MSVICWVEMRSYNLVEYLDEFNSRWTNDIIYYIDFIILEFSFRFIIMDTEQEIYYPQNYLSPQWVKTFFSRIEKTMLQFLPSPILVILKRSTKHLKTQQCNNNVTRHAEQLYKTDNMQEYHIFAYENASVPSVKHLVTQ